MSAIRVLLVDDHKLFRAGIRSLLQAVSGVEVVAEAGDGREALRLIEAHRPDVVLMDIMMPSLNGLDATARLVRTFPHSRVIMLSMNADHDSVLQTLRAGAAGYLVKTADPAELELAIRAAVRGETFLSSAISNHVIAACLGCSRRSIRDSRGKTSYSR
jgi:DNA-binding NarL/FixJ family response regulator